MTVKIIKFARLNSRGNYTTGYSIYHIKPVSSLIDKHHEGWYLRKKDAIARAMNLEYDIVSW